MTEVTTVAALGRSFHPTTVDIVVDGVRVHNLKDVSVRIPLGKLTVVTGVSGAGKSSLVFDTLYAEAQRRYLQSFSAASRQLLERFDRPAAEHIGDLPPAVALRRHMAHGPRATVGSLTEIGDYLRLLLARAGIVHCTRCGQPVRAANPDDVLAAVRAFPSGTRFSIAFAARPESPDDLEAWAAGLLEEGLIRVQMGDAVLRLGEQPLPPLGENQDVWVILDRLEAGKATEERLSESVEAAFTRGQDRVGLLSDGSELVFDRLLRCPRCDIVYPMPEPRLFAANDPAALAVRYAGRNIAEWSALSLGELAAALAPLSPLGRGSATPSTPFPNGERGASVLLDQLRRRLALHTAVDLGHLTLLRPAATLSGGMTVRLRLAGALAANLAQALYLIEEPTADLHPRDVGKLIGQLHELRAAGNTVVVIEHNRAVVAAADHVVEIGPGAGDDGGRITYEGPATRDEIPPVADGPGSPRKPRGVLRLQGARTHNLQNLTVEIPLGVLCVVTGVGGAGKRSLVEHTLYPALLHAKHKKGAPPAPAKVIAASQIEDVILMDQQPLPRSSRSNPATYLKIFDEVREVFAAAVEAKIRNFGPGTFSFNQPGGRCESCEGQGALTVDMQFLADVTITCPECQGQRYRREVLDVKVRGLSIAEVLDLTAREAFRFFRAQPAVERRLKHLLDVGLDYLRLGQPVDTLSGGEAQRLKLAGHLAASRKPRCLFLLIEPSAGLHPLDVQVLLASLDRLLAAGHSLVVVEHDLDVIARADHVIDLGPEGGADGGRLVATGTPEEVAQVPASPTGQCLAR
jgi:excinuclease ABC subunit A